MRTEEQVERKWNDLKGNAKKNVGASSTEKRMTGSGINVVKIPTEDYKIVSIVVLECASGLPETDNLDTSILMICTKQVRKSSVRL